MNNDYSFLTRWRVRGSIHDVYDLISHPLDYPRWWPSVYLRVDELPPNPGGGKRVRLLTKGWLPYKLRWESEVVNDQPPHRLEIRATGDFDGRGIWTLEPDGDNVNVTFDWRLKAEKPLLRILSPVLKPVFEANHRWAMEQGRISLEQELQRR